MQIKYLVILILLGYMIAMVCMSIRSKRYSGSFLDSMTAGGEASLLLLTGSALGSHIGSGFVVGGAEYGALYGLGGAWYGIGCGVSFLVCGIFLTKFIYRRRYLSLMDYFMERYQNRSISLISTFSTLLCSMAIFSSQLLAGKAIFYVAGIDGNLGIALTSIVALVYTTMSGFWGAMTVALLQSAVIFISILGALFVLYTGSGTEILFASLPQSHFDLFAMDAETLVMLTVPTVTSCIVSQPIFQRISSAKSERGAVRSHLIAGVLLIFIAFIPVLLGMYGKSFFPALPTSELFSRVAAERLPLLLGALLLSSVICAVISACNGTMISISTNIIHDLFQSMFKTDITDQQCRRYNGIVNVAVSVTGVLIAVAMDNIIKLLSLGYTFITAGCLIPFVGGILWRGGNAKGAVASAVTGIAFVLLDAVKLIQMPFISVTSLVPSMIVYVAVSILTRGSKD